MKQSKFIMVLYLFSVVSADVFFFLFACQMIMMIHHFGQEPYVIFLFYYIPTFVNDDKNDAWVVVARICL